MKPYYLWSERRRHRFMRTCLVVGMVAVLLIFSYVVPVAYGGCP